MGRIHPRRCAHRLSSVFLLMTLLIGCAPDTEGGRTGECSDDGACAEINMITLPNVVGKTLRRARVALGSFQVDATTADDSVVLATAKVLRQHPRTKKYQEGSVVRLLVEPSDL